MRIALTLVGFVLLSVLGFAVFRIGAGQPLWPIVAVKLAASPTPATATASLDITAFALPSAWGTATPPAAGGTGGQLKQTYTGGRLIVGTKPTFSATTYQSYDVVRVSYVGKQCIMHYPDQVIKSVACTPVETKNSGTAYLTAPIADGGAAYLLGFVLGSYDATYPLITFYSPVTTSSEVEAFKQILGSVSLGTGGSATGDLTAASPAASPTVE